MVSLVVNRLNVASFVNEFYIFAKFGEQFKSSSRLAQLDNLSLTIPTDNSQLNSCPEMKSFSKLCSISSVMNSLKLNVINWIFD